MIRGNNRERKAKRIAANLRCLVDGVGDLNDSIKLDLPPGYTLDTEDFESPFIPVGRVLGKNTDVYRRGF
jgi:hypothetical protein